MAICWEEITWVTH